MVLCFMMTVLLFRKGCSEGDVLKGKGAGGVFGAVSSIETVGCGERNAHGREKCTDS